MQHSAVRSVVFLELKNAVEIGGIHRKERGIRAILNLLFEEVYEFGIGKRGEELKMILSLVLVSEVAEFKRVRNQVRKFVF